MRRTDPMSVGLLFGHLGGRPVTPLVRLSIRHSILLSVGMSSVLLYVRRSIHLWVCLSVRPSVCLSVRQTVSPSILCWSVCPSVRLSVRSFVRPFVCPKSPCFFFSFSATDFSCVSSLVLFDNAAYLPSHSFASQLSLSTFP